MQSMQPCNHVSNSSHAKNVEWALSVSNGPKGSKWTKDGA